MSALPKARVMWTTKNPCYPEAHGNLYAHKRLCDALWGRRDTVVCVIIPCRTATEARAIVRKNRRAKSCR